HVVVVHVDIAGVRRVDQSLRASEQTLREVVEQPGVVLWLCEATVPRVLYVSPAYERLVGRKRESLYLQPASVFDSVHPDDREALVEAIRQGGIRRGETLDRAFRVVRPDGSERRVRARAVPLHNEKAEVVRIAGIALEIPQRPASTSP
ncbi:MAG: PAS domain-containing protein, partial [Planctomycetota bacterium]